MKTKQTKPIGSSMLDVGCWMFDVALSLLLLSAASASAATRYVWQSTPSPAPPYSNWATAARVIQDAVDAALPGDEIVVTNGTYATGGRAVGTNVLVNRVAVDKPLTLRSVNGPQFTIIQGYQVPGTTNGDGAIRCVYLTNGASLSGFTLTNGATHSLGSEGSDDGGGVACESGAVVINCMLVGNSAGFGGGALSGVLNNCTLVGNSSQGSGGGAWASTLHNCRLSGNSATAGGGAAWSEMNNCELSGNFAEYTGGGAVGGILNNCTLVANSANVLCGGVDGGFLPAELNNCIVNFNSAQGAANFNYSTLNYCCTTPMPSNGVGNITNAPLFVDYAGGNLRLQANSPCINAGNNVYATGPTDRDGNPRIVSGTVDIGAYEFQETGSVISYAWLQQFGLPTDGTADLADTDADGLNNWQEWRCGTCPTDANSALRLLSTQRTGTDVTVTWQSVAGVNYFLECSTNLSATSCFKCAATNLLGQPGTTSYTDTNVAGASPLFYRVGVGN